MVNSNPAQFEVDFDFSQVNDPDWFRGNAAISHWFDAYTLLVPENEAFYIRSLKHLVRSASPEEKRTLRLFFGQEARHGEAHRLYIDRMNTLGLNTRKFTAIANGLFYSVLEPLQPTALKISIVAAIEHVNAFMAHVILSKDLFLGCQWELRRLFYWHFAEEIEHKCVAHDLLMRDHPSYLLRVLGGIIGFSAFFLASFAGMCFLLAQRRRLLRRKTLVELREFWITAGVLREVLTHLSAYFSPRFDPRNLSDNALVDQTRNRLMMEAVVSLAPSPSHGVL